MVQTASFLILFLCFALSASGSLPGSPILLSKFIGGLFLNVKNYMYEYCNKEYEMAKNGGAMHPYKKATDSSMTRSKYADPCVREQEKKNRPFDCMTEELIKKRNLSPDQVCNDLPKYPMDSGELKECRDECMESEPQGDCDPDCKYRTANGRCNNLEHPNWGMSLICQTRLLRPYYKGCSDFRESVCGKPLPNARKLSLELHSHQDLPTKEWTHMFMFFGQILDHDIVSTPISTTVGNKPIQCCPIKKEMHPQCAPISICPQDPVYGKYGITCMNFVRSAVCRTCKMGYRSPINSVTSFIDCSIVYGNSDEETKSLRTDDDSGCLRSQPSEYGELLPPTDDPENDHCSFPETNEICFKAGDFRCNIFSGLTFLHTILLREHNYLARKLKFINPHWCGDRTFQEARRILIAEWQFITFGDFIIIVLGREKATEYHLPVLEGTNRTCYDQKLDPTVNADFTSGPFRFGHTLINDKIVPKYGNHSAISLKNNFFQPFDLYHGTGSEIAKHACEYETQAHDRHLIPDVTDHLYKVRGDPVGLDLAAINIQRGRDHGMRPYVDFVCYCSGKNITRFEQLVLYDLMTEENVKLLKASYCDVRDVDVWTGLFYEKHLTRRVVGNTAACIIGPMFQKLKFGDRFYFEHKDQAGSFTDAQLLEIKKTTLTALLCRHEKVEELQTRCMLFPNPEFNNKIKCKELERIDLSHWKEENPEDCSDVKEDDPEDCSDCKEEYPEYCSDCEEEYPEYCSDGNGENPEYWSDE